MWIIKNKHMHLLKVSSQKMIKKQVSIDLPLASFFSFFRASITVALQLKLKGNGVIICIQTAKKISLR